MTKIIRVTRCADCPNMCKADWPGGGRYICTLTRSSAVVSDYMATGATLPPWCPLEQDRSDELQALLSALFGIVAGREEFERDNPGIIRQVRAELYKEHDEP